MLGRGGNILARVTIFICCIITPQSAPALRSSGLLTGMELGPLLIPQAVYWHLACTLCDLHLQILLVHVQGSDERINQLKVWFRTLAVYPEEAERI